MSAHGPFSSSSLDPLQQHTLQLLTDTLQTKTEKEYSFETAENLVKAIFPEGKEQLATQMIDELRTVQRPEAKPVTAADLSARLNALILEGEDDLNKDAEFLARVGESQAAIVRQMGEVADSLGREADAVLAQSRSRFV